MSPRISSHAGRLAPRYDAVVIGSGYGGGVAALRLAQAGADVCVLERGRELAPQDFPDGAAAAAAEVRVHGRSKGKPIERGARGGLFDLVVFDEVTAVVGSGLGGTSLINANVFLEPEPRLFDDPRWPGAVRGDRAGLDRGLERARAVLDPTPWRGRSQKLEPFERAAASLGTEYRRLPLMVQQSGGDARFHECTGCGDCVSGCRVGAKRSVDRTYLARAHELGATLITEVAVEHVEATQAGWAVFYRAGVPRLASHAAPSFVLAGSVVLAAGVFGSTEILLRSRARGLALSECLGSQVSTNANAVVVVLDAPSAGGAAEPADDAPEGPCIVGAMALDDGAVRVEDGSIPRALDAMVALESARRELETEPSGPGLLGRWASRARNLVAVGVELLAGSRPGARALLAQGHDGSSGRLSLDEDGETMLLSRPRSPDDERAMRSALERVARELGGAVRDPAALLPSGGSVTVHPLGGCPMGDDADVGVVDERGRVFDPHGADRRAVHRGLYVLDGSIVPTSVGVNPVATICTLAERACEVVVPEVVASRAPAAHPPRPEPASAPEVAPAARPIGASFSEAFSGWVSQGVERAFALDELGAPRPASETAELALVLFVDDVDRFLLDPTHAATAIGTLSCPALHERPLSVAGGRVSLFSDDPVRRGRYYLTYDLPLVALDGRRFRLTAMKTFGDGGPARVYRDGTTLPISVAGDSALLSGLLAMRARDVAGTVVRVRVHGHAPLADRLRAQARFEAFFARRWIERLRFEAEAP